MSSMVILTSYVKRFINDGGTFNECHETRKLTKFFGKNAALQGLDLTVRQGEFMALSVPMGQAKPLQYVSF